MLTIQRRFIAPLALALCMGACSFSPNVPNGHIICKSGSECPSGYTCEDVTGAELPFKVCCKDKGCGGRVMSTSPLDGSKSDTSNDLVTLRDGPSTSPESGDQTSTQLPDVSPDQVAETPETGLPDGPATPDVPISDDLTTDILTLPDGPARDAYQKLDLPDGPSGPEVISFQPDGPPSLSPDSSRDVYVPDVYIPDAYVPDVYVPDVYTPDGPLTCANDQDCPTSAPTCLGNACIKCTIDPNCTGNPRGSLCDTNTGRCANCLTNSDCTSTPSKPYCGNGICTACPYATTGGCCNDSDCTLGGAGTAPKCDTTQNKCSYPCDSSHMACGDKCVPSDGCCTDNQCIPTQPNMAGTCVSNNCSYDCDSTHKKCSGSTTCVPKSNCCSDGDCNPGYMCNSNGGCALLPGCPTDPSVPTVDCACNSPGTLACNGAHQALKLKCLNGLWMDNGTCPQGQNCQQDDGQCHDIISGCLTSSAFCSDPNTMQTCNADRTATTTTPCTGVCSNNACQPATCGDLKVESGEQCDDGNTVTADGCEPDCKKSSVLALTAGAAFTCALVSSGEARCWGDNTYAQLGIGAAGTQYYTSQPYTLGPVNFGEKATAIASGLYHACVILASGTVRCWGANDQGQHGLGDTSARNGIAPAINFGTPATKLAAGGNTTCAILQNGELHCWGYNGSGMLGLATTGSPSQGTPAVNLGAISIGGAATSVSVGTDAVCAARADGSVICWGSNGSGQLGRADTQTVGGSQVPAAATPPAVPIMPGSRKATALASGSGHTCALMDNGYLECWGPNSAGQLGLGLPASGGTLYIGDDEPPATSGGLQLAAVVLVYARNTSTCAGTATGGLRCWGLNSKAQLGYGDGTANKGGDGSSKPSNLPDISFGSGVSATAVAMGSTHVCALLNNGQVKCWGRDNLGQLGNATILTSSPDYIGGDTSHTPDQLSPVLVFPPP
jgi:alpha-tubulin suppressor-like RCC1 family protein